MRLSAFVVAGAVICGIGFAMAHSNHNHTAEPAEDVEEAVAQEGALDLPNAGCAAVAARGWRAWIDAGADGAPTLHIRGEVDAPSPNYSVEIEAGPADRRQPPAQTFRVSLSPATGYAAQVITPTPVVYDGPATYGAYRALVLMCGWTEIARITEFDGAE